MKTIVLAEKPSVGRELAGVLNCREKRDGFFEGPQYIVTWALGHLVALAEPDDYQEAWKTWRLEDLPMLPERMKTKVIGKTSNQFRVVKSLLQRGDVQSLVIATDAGREGELVARWIMEKSGWQKSFQRLWISSQTDQAIREGFARLRPGRDYDNLYQAAVARSEADWLIGLNVSRALTCKFDAQLNAGRVQTPTLSMIASRELEIRKFQPVSYWTLRADFGDYFGHWHDRNGNGRIFDSARANELLTKTERQTGTVVEVESKEKSEPPPLAYDLTELQRDANRRYGFSAKKTLSIAQVLYERFKVITYPRTDSRYITSDLVGTLDARLRSVEVGPYARSVETLRRIGFSPGKRLVNDSKVSDHHALLPTEQPLRLEELSSDERKVCDLVVRRFLETLFPPCRYEHLRLVTEVSGERFYSRGKSMREKGWKEVSAPIPSDAVPEDDEIPEQALSLVNRGETREVKKCRLEKGNTRPPQRYTEATLLTAMESPGKFIEDEELRESIKQGGLGTPATRAEIIEKLFSCDYVERDGNRIKPTSKGMQLIELVPEELKSPELTARWEQRLADISRGKDRKESFVDDIRANAVELVRKIKQDASTYRPDNVTKTKCPSCGQYLLLVSAKKGKMLKCPDRLCGYSQPEKQGEGFGLRTSRAESRKNKALIAQYSDKSEIGTNVGALLQEALKKKGKESEKK